MFFPAGFYFILNLTLFFFLKVNYGFTGGCAHIDKLLNAKLVLHSWDKPHLVLMYFHFYILMAWLASIVLNILCVCIYVHEDY